MTKIDPHLFRSYDIRGTVPDQINEEVCKLAGRAFGSVLREMYAKENPEVIVGRDARTHGSSLMSAVIEGLVSVGCRVKIIGETPSPVNFFAVCNGGFDGSMQVTASHNEAQFNGLKLQTRSAEAFAGEDIQSLLKRIKEKNFLSGKGSVEDYDAITPYKKKLGEMFSEIGENLKIAVDNGNGISGPVYNAVLKETGCSLIEIFSEPNGNFPNHLADPSKYETLKILQKKVKEEKADLGIAFDGDGDRVGFVDEKGKIRTPDEILLLLAKGHLKRNPGGTVIFTVSNSGVLETEIKKWGGKPLMCKVGHSHVEHAMRKHRAKLGGEQSGHFFCAENYYGYDDALFAALKVIEILSKSEKPFSELFGKFPEVFQMPELRPHCPDEKKSGVVNDAVRYFSRNNPVNTLDGARIDFGDGAWAGIRQSNTAPRLSICMEARSEEKLEEVKGMVLGHLKKYREIEWE